MRGPERAGRVWERPRGMVLWEVNKGSGLQFTLGPQERLQSRAGPEAGHQGQAATSQGRPRALPLKPG